MRSRYYTIEARHNRAASLRQLSFLIPPGSADTHTSPAGTLILWYANYTANRYVH